MEKLSTIDILRWYFESGVDETIANIPQDRYQEYNNKVDLGSNENLSNLKQPSSSIITPFDENIQESEKICKAATSVEELYRLLCDFDGFHLKKTATNLVFGDGNTKSKIVFIGDAPGAEEDRQGKPFVGQGGKLLDKMLASINLDRSTVFLSNTIFWRPPGNRTPTSQEIAQCLPFVHRLIELIEPFILVVLGGLAARSLLSETLAVGRLRGKWFNYERPSLSRPIKATVLFHPEYLINSPVHKREAWQDLLMIQEMKKKLN